MTLTIAAALFVLAVAVSVGPAVIVRQMRQAELARLTPGSLVLTYDDGPGKRFTPQLLDLLAEYNARATFYFVGFRADDAPQLAQRTIDDGHEIGNHGYWHRNAWLVTPWRSVKDVRDGFNALRKWCTDSMSYRPPFGKLTTWSWLAARGRGAALHWWTCDARDQAGSRPDPETIVDDLLRDGGGVVLMHSHDSGVERERYILDLTRRLLETAAQQRWRVCTISELAEANVQRVEGAAA